MNTLMMIMMQYMSAVNINTALDHHRICKLRLPTISVVDGGWKNMEEGLKSTNAAYGAVMVVKKSAMPFFHGGAMVAI